LAGILNFMDKTYKPIVEYFLTIKSGNQFYRYFKFEQGQDKSLYIKWNLLLAQHKDGDYNHRSYFSYHSKYDSKNKGYRVHLYGCGGNRIPGSISYRKKFISEYNQPFFTISFNNSFDHIELLGSDSRDIVFNIENGSNLSKFKLQVFSDRRRDLLIRNYPNEFIKELKFQGYSLIVRLLVKI